MPLVPLEEIVNRENVRKSAVSAIADEGLRQSIAAVGVLQPILLRPLSDIEIVATGPGKKWKIVLGARRTEAARHAGHAVIPADIRMDMTDAQAAAAQLAENMQRADMHPVDLWEGVHGLIAAHGMTFNEAAAALGLDHRATRRLDMLGRLDAGLLKLARIQMPSEQALRLISAAPAKLQRQAARGKGLSHDDGEGVRVSWNEIAGRCAVHSIPRTRALFDWVAADGLIWDEDLFAEPGSDEQFTTADIEGFMRRQTEALAIQIGTLPGAGRGRHRLANMKLNGYDVALPKGFERVWDGKPDKLRRFETAFHAIKANGDIIVHIGIDMAAANAAAQGRAAVAAEGAPAAEPDDAEDPSPAADDAPAAKSPFTQKARILTADAKGAAMRKALETPMTPAQTLTLLVLALAGGNIQVSGMPATEFPDLAARLLAPGGTLLDLPDGDVVAIGQTAVGRLIRFDAPNVGNRHTSGASAEWIGAAVRAGDHLDRFDTEEFLATVSVAELKAAANAAGMKYGGTADELRKRLTGHLPDWRPSIAVFGAPAPKVAA